MLEQDETEATEPKPDAVEPEPEYDVEEHAKRLGWRPPEEMDDPDKALSAEEFVKRGEDNAALAITNNRKLQQRIDAMEREFSDMRRFHEMQLTAREQQIKEQYEEKMRKAVEEGDVNEFDKLSKKREDALKEAKPSEQPQQTANPEVDSAVSKFESETPWYGVDRAMTVFAREESQRLSQEAPNMTPEAHLSKVRQITEDAFNRTQQPKPKAEGAPAVESGRRNVGTGKKSETYENMPAEYRQACDSMVRRGVNKDEFVKNYFASQRAQGA